MCSILLFFFVSFDRSPWHSVILFAILSPEELTN